MFQKMNLLLLLLCVIIVFSCSSEKFVSGEYHKKGEDYQYNLSLEKDSTFELTIHYPDVNPKCKGKWFYETKNTILLKCYEENDLITQLSTGYMAERERKIFVLNSNKIRIDKIILKRVR